ncbi:response regulator [Pseudoalteromonas sp. MMG005]|uniref:response regulator n=1 Tax=Pseudoalteromonas sp. MMG005 TaxID=2822682 RepID=UPI001B3A5F0D|nr:response regulator [Pseudoalteromonas sp. MMG005]MBQ4847215.1 response regulator [Pseudoalteromonas sp. MMG005]
MARKEIEHIERHPKVVLLCNKVEELSGVSDIISSQVSAFRVLTKMHDIKEVLLESAPLVIIIAMPSVSASIELYRQLAQLGFLDYPHENILLCENKESGVGFRCCMKHVFSDYFVYKPMYENYRLRMILHNALLRCKNAHDTTHIREEHFGKIDVSLKQLIDDAAVYHVDAQQTLTNARKNLEQAKGVNDIQTALMKELRAQHIDPLLDQLEKKLAMSIEELTNNLKNKQITLAELSALLIEKSLPETTRSATEYAAEDPSDKVIALTNRNIKIMVVEDNEIYREMISKILIDEGHNVEAVSSGLVAIKKLKKQKYDMIFMDLFMPELDGYNTTRNIRNINHCKNLPIVALTSNKNKELIRKWATLGLTAYIAKPSTKHSILKTVEKAKRALAS